MRKINAEIVREFGPFPGIEHIHGVSYDQGRVWFASGDKLTALDPDSGSPARSFAAEAHAGTAFDGEYLYQVAGTSIHKIDPATGEVLTTIPAPENGCAGLAWAEGSLWAGQYRARRILQLDPQTGRILKTLNSSRFVTGVTWVSGQLWHGTMEGEESGLLQVEPDTGEALTMVEMPPGTSVTGLESDGADLFYCGGGASGKIRAVRRPG